MFIASKGNKYRVYLKSISISLVFALLCSVFPSLSFAADRGAWAPNVNYAVNDTATYTGSTYKALQAHTSQVGWEPPTTPALWQLSSGGTPGDTQAPTAPGSLRSTGAATTSISLAWNASTDNVGVTGYDVFNGSSLAQTVTGTSATVGGLTPNTTYTFTVKAKDAAGNSSAASNAVSTATPQNPPGAANPIPGKIEAEAWTAMSGVQTEATTDTGGGTNVGWIETGDWMDYSVNVQSAGSYKVEYRVASMGTAGQIQLQSGATVLATTNLPNTGGWQNWTTVSAVVQLNGGTQTIRLYAAGGGFNVNWLNFAVNTGTARDAFSVIQAESFDAMLGVQTEATSDVGAGQNVGYIDNNDWLKFNSVNFGSGPKSVDARIASNTAGGTIEFRLDSTTGTLIGSVNVGSTGGWQTWATNNGAVSGASGIHDLYLVFKGSTTNGLMNLNWIQFKSTTTPPPPTSGYKKIAYVAGWANWSAIQLQANKLTHINYAFSNIVNGEVGYGNGSESNFATLRNLKSQYPHLKTLISVGGWGADGFSDAALTDASRTRFADSAVAFMKQNGFDGVDLDWEYPGQPGPGIKFRPEDKTNFTLMLRKLREKLNTAGQQDGKSYLMTIAAGASSAYVQNTEMSQVAQLCDFVNLMTYDFHGSWEARTGHHTNLYGYDNSTDAAVNLFMSQGVPANKLVIGMAFYGKYWNNVQNTSNGFNQPTGGGGGDLAYSDLAASYINKNGYTRYWDDTAKAPYLFNGSTFITYDDPASISAKTGYIKSKGLAGGMFWEYSQDNTGALLDSLHNGLQ
jgi:GH18 family chitinase/chitodextrinase